MYTHQLVYYIINIVVVGVIWFYLLFTYNSLVVCTFIIFAQKICDMMWMNINNDCVILASILKKKNCGQKSVRPEDDLYVVVNFQLRIKRLKGIFNKKKTKKKTFGMISVCVWFANFYNIPLMNIYGNEHPSIMFKILINILNICLLWNHLMNRHWCENFLVYMKLDYWFFSFLLVNCDIRYISNIFWLINWLWKKFT